MLDLKSKIQAFKSKKILVIGDLILDRYLFGKTERISPEAPVPVVQLTDNDHRLGGAANVALNLKKLGAEVAICGIVGNDEYGDKTTKLLDDQDIDIDLIIKSNSRSSTVKSRVISHGQQIIRVDSEDTSQIDIQTSEHLIEQVKLRINEFDCCIIQDYEKGLLHQGNIKALIKLCKDANVYIAVDPKKENFWLYNGVDLFKPNLSELSSSLNKSIDSKSENEIRKALNSLNEKLDHKLSVLTLSSDGIAVMEKNQLSVVPTTQNSVFDVSGAGDTVICVFALSAICDITPLDAAKLANIAAHIVCQKLGVSPILYEELELALDGYDS